MSFRSFLLAFVLVSCLLGSEASGPSLSIISWLPKHRQFCNVSLSTGTISNCFGLPSVYLMGSSGVTYKDHIYIAAQNLSASGTPWEALSISINQKEFEWGNEFTSNNYSPYMTTYSTSLGMLVMAGSNGYTWVVSNQTQNMWYSFGYGQQGTFDQTLQEYWGLTTSYIYRQNVLSKSYTEIQNQYNIVAAAVSSNQVLYCIAQAADASLLYSYDTYLHQWGFVGCMANMVPIPYGATVLDPTETYMTFLATVSGKITLVTINVVDASITYSIASPDPGILLLQGF